MHRKYEILQANLLQLAQFLDEILNGVSLNPLELDDSAYDTSATKL